MGDFRKRTARSTGPANGPSYGRDRGQSVGRRRCRLPRRVGVAARSLRRQDPLQRAAADAVLGFVENHPQNPVKGVDEFVD